MQKTSEELKGKKEGDCAGENINARSHGEITTHTKNRRKKKGQKEDEIRSQQIKKREKDQRRKITSNVQVLNKR